jgi:hypothetical protein
MGEWNRRMRLKSETSFRLGSTTADIDDVYRPAGGAVFFAGRRLRLGGKQTLAVYNSIHNHRRKVGGVRFLCVFRESTAGLGRLLSVRQQPE